MTKLTNLIMLKYPTDGQGIDLHTKHAPEIL